MYQIPISVYDLRTKVREQFEKNKHVTDIRVADVLLLKGRQEYQETINYWKTPVRPPPPCFVILSACKNHRLGRFVVDDTALSSHTSWAGSTNKRCASQPHPPTSVPFADPFLPYSNSCQDNCEISISFVAREVFVWLTSFSSVDLPAPAPTSFMDKFLAGSVLLLFRSIPSSLPVGLDLTTLSSQTGRSGRHFRPLRIPAAFSSPPAHLFASLHIVHELLSIR